MFWLVFTVILVFLQMTLVPAAFGGQAPLDILLVSLIIWSVLTEGKGAIGLAFIGGLLLSHFSTLHFGFLPLFYVLLTYLASLVQLESGRANLLITTAVGGTLFLVFELLLILSYTFSGYPWGGEMYLRQVVLVRVLANTGLLLILFPLYQKLVGWLSHPMAGITSEDL